MDRFRWLHLTDLHHGMAGHSWLWPTVRQAFEDDLKKVLPWMGGLELVVFSGDLTQSGSEAEFAALEDSLAKLWDLFGSLGTTPKLAVVPGNHDLRRPAKMDAYAKVLLDDWWTAEGDVQDDFWHNADSKYRSVVSEAFKNFLDWKHQTKLPLVSAKEGVVPGDFAATLEYSGARIGVVGLNTSFLHLNDSAQGQLDTSERQIHSVCDGDAANWRAKHDFSLLLTHHPSDWLHPRAQERFKMEVAPVGRFLFHFCGHMHEPLAEVTSSGGAEPLRTLRGRSLFGLEHYGHETRHKRLHGYSCGLIDFSAANQALIWPRKSETGLAGQFKIVPDFQYELHDDQAFRIELKLPQTRDTTSTIIAPNIASENQPGKVVAQSLEGSTAKPATALLSGLPQFNIRPSPQHEAVRIQEQQQLNVRLDNDKAVWLVADWGLGKDGFLSTVLRKRASSQIIILRCEHVTSLDSLDAECQKQWGVSFQEFCAMTSAADSAILLLDDIPLPGGIEGPHWLDRVLTPALEFAPSLSVVLCARDYPKASRFPVVALKYLDEAECAQYVSAHPDGGSEYGSIRTIERLFSLSEGVPMHLDRLLRQLQFASLDDLREDVLIQEPLLDDGESPPASLVSAIGQLEVVTEKYAKRSLRLLKVLAVLPSGEVFQNLRKFDHSEPFYPQNVEQLRALGLLEIVPIAALPSDANNKVDPGAAKLLIVPRPVRDLLARRISAEERRSIVDAALDLYFGRWREGKPTLNSVTKIVIWQNGVSGLGNHQAVLLAALRDAQERSDARRITAIFGVCEAFLEALKRAHRFRDLLQASEELYFLFKHTSDEREIAKVAWYYGHSLRMTGRGDEARKLLGETLELVGTGAPKATQARVLLDLALANERLDPVSAVGYAERVISLTEKTSPQHLQAKSLIIQNSDKDPDELRNELVAIEDTARRNDFVGVANNVALSLAIGETGLDSKIRWYDRVLDGKDDRYNKIRARIWRARAKIELAGDNALSVKEINELSAAYGFLYSQRLSGLFDECHRIVWRVSKAAGNVSRMLRMFRFSSFLWRIFGKDDAENAYIAELQAAIGRDEGGVLPSQEREYFIARLRASRPSTEQHTA